MCGVKMLAKWEGWTELAIFLLGVIKKALRLMPIWASNMADLEFEATVE